MSCPGCPVPVVLSRLCCLILDVLSKISFLRCHALAVLSSVSNLGCPDPTILCCCLVLTFLSRLSYLDCPVPPLLSLALLFPPVLCLLSCSKLSALSLTVLAGIFRHRCPHSCLSLRCPVPVDQYQPSYPSCHLLAVLSSLFSPGWPVPSVFCYRLLLAVLSQLSYTSCILPALLSCFNHPILSWLICSSSCPVLAVLSCPRCRISTVLHWLSCACSPVLVSWAVHGCPLKIVHQ